MVTTDDLIEVLYGDDPDGGPLFANGTIRRLAVELRRRHPDFDLQAVKAIGAGGGWRLHPPFPP